LVRFVFVQDSIQELFFVVTQSAGNRTGRWKLVFYFVAENLVLRAKSETLSNAICLSYL